VVLGGCSGLPPSQAERAAYLASYIEAHYRDLGQEFVAPVSREEFRTRLNNTRILFLGDHHQDAALHTKILALLSWISKQGKPVVLGIEAIGTQDDQELQDYLAGKIRLNQLRRRIANRWSGSWLDSQAVDHDFFQDLLRTARHNQMPVFPLEPTPRLNLASRDIQIARNIRRALRRYPNHLIVIVVGHAHLLGQGHLLARIGAPSLAIGARLSVTLTKKLKSQRPCDTTSFLQTDQGILFFPGRQP